MFSSKVIMRVCLILAATLIFTTSAAKTTGGCSITLPTDLPKPEPVILISDSAKTYKLFKPTGQKNLLPTGTKLFLLCSGGKNGIAALNKQSIELICRGGAFETTSGDQYKLNELGCSDIPYASLKKTDESCANGKGKIHKSGFEYETKTSSGFEPVFSICYDNSNENTFYTHNILNGAAMKYGVKESARRPFRADGMKGTTAATNRVYTVKNQISKFEKLFGRGQNYVSPKNFMSRGHLSPDADFIFGYEQLATYFYANVAPQFQAINGGNWVRVESLARDISAALNDDVEIYNGYIGLLQLPKPTGGLVPIYLDAANEIEAPEYYFKVIKHEPTDSAIVMITSNNPFLESGDEFCKNVCEKADLNMSYFTNLKRGYTFCCELNDFKKHYDHLPASLKASNLLTKPKSVHKI